MFDFTNLFLKLQLQLKIGNIPPSCKLAEQVGNVSLPPCTCQQPQFGHWGYTTVEISPYAVGRGLEKLETRE